MKGIVFMVGWELELMEFPEPETGPRDVVSEIKASGMYVTGLSLYRREYKPGVTTSGGRHVDGHFIGGHADCTRFVSDRKIDVDILFTHNWQLEDAKEAYQLFDQHKTGNGVFLPA